MLVNLYHHVTLWTPYWTISCYDIWLTISVVYATQGLCSHRILRFRVVYLLLELSPSIVLWVSRKPPWYRLWPYYRYLFRIRLVIQTTWQLWVMLRHPPSFAHNLQHFIYISKASPKESTLIWPKCQRTHIFEYDYQRSVESLIL